MWFALAEKLGMSVQRLQAETSSTEFIMWTRYIKQTENQPSRADWYVMQVALTIAQQNMSKKDKSNVSLKDYVLKPSTKQPRPTLAEYIRRSKSFFAGLTGMKNGK